MTYDTLFFSYSFITSLMLFYNAIRDIRTRTIDDRLNYLCLGASLMMFAYVRPGLIVLAAVIAFTVLASIILKNAYAPGDISAFQWLFFGVGCLNIYYLPVFLMILACMQAIISIIARFGLKLMDKLPGYPIILGSWIIFLLLANF